MHNCIFASHCVEHMCDRSCPILTETSYLLERNNIKMDNPVFKSKDSDISRALSILHESNGKLKTVTTDQMSTHTTLLTYCAICENWHGSRLHCNVFNLKFANHVDAIQKSWSLKAPPESLEYEQIWSLGAKVLIISNLDYVQFKDFQSQTMLNLLHNRLNDGLTTIVVSPPSVELIGEGKFFNELITMLFEPKKGKVITW